MTKQTATKKRYLSLALAGLLLSIFPAAAHAQYNQYNLVSTAQDPNLVNGWGLAFFPTGPFWVSDNGTGLSTLYDHSGSIQGLVVTIPTAPSQPFGPIGSPTGIVASSKGGFQVSANGSSGPSFFIYDTLDGTLSGWSPAVSFSNAILAVDNSASGAIYTGLTMATNENGTFLYAADAGNNKIDMFDSNFNLVSSFTDPATPPGMAVYGIQNVQGRLYVTLANIIPLQGGAVDVFNSEGKLLQRLTGNGPEGPLEGPWGIALAPSDFGTYSNALLVGDLDDGHINAYDPKTGVFLGQLMHPNGKAIAIKGLWALKFGAGNPANGDKNQLFFTAGPQNFKKGLFGMIAAKGVD